MTVRRLIVMVLIVLQIAVPAIGLIARWDDPSRGQIPFGWQMHTSCWGRVDPCR